VLRIVGELARLLEPTALLHQGVAPSCIRIGYDGSVGFDAAPGVRDAAYLAPEAQTGSTLVGRSDVFALGAIVWELFAGARLFARESEALTHAAIAAEPTPVERAIASAVPPGVAAVIATALMRDKRGRFDTVPAFAHAFSQACASAGIQAASPTELARWVAELVPRGAAVPDLDVPSVPASRRSSGPQITAPPPSGSPTSVRTAAAAAFSDAALSLPSSRAIAIDVGADDDFDMQIERNLTTSAAPASISSRPSGTHASRPSLPRAGSGLELGAPQRRSARPSSRPQPEVGFVAKLVGFVVAMVLLAAAAAAAFRFGHRAGGRSLTALLPHAFDGLSATDSGAVALGALVVAAIVIFVGLRLRPHAWLVVLSGGALLFLALAMVTVTLASTGDNPTPPDGVLLVPYLAPAGLLLLALGMGARAGRRLAHASGAGRVLAVPLALAAGALAFVALEVSRFAP
jgi:hypothetical protein